MVPYFGWIIAALTIASLSFSKLLLTRAFEVLPHPDRRLAQEVLQQFRMQWLILSAVYFGFVVAAGVAYQQTNNAVGMAIPGLYVFGYGWLYQKVQQKLTEGGLPSKFCRQFMVSKGMILAGFLVSGAYIMSLLNSFNKN
jgi:hypothetical protein